MTPPLFDPNHRHQSRIRAEKKGGERFIFDRLAEDYAERLRLINRTFEKQGNVAFELPSDENYDLLTSHLALQAQEDVVGQLIQTRLKLRPDGLFLGTILGGESLKELRLAFLAAESELGLPHRPHILPFMEVKTAGSLLQRAGFTLPVVESEIITLNYVNLSRFFADLRAHGATNCMVSRSRQFMSKKLWVKMCEIYAAQFRNAQGKFIVTLEILHLLGWSPHESQQKPMARGAAKQGFSAFSLKVGDL